MAAPGEVAVIGLGRFGRSLVDSLVRVEQPVLAIDRDRARVEAMADRVDAVVICDTTLEESLAEMRLERMACVVVAIGEKAREASILTTALLRQIGVPRIVGRSFNELHARVLRAVGAHEVVNPEEEMGKRLAEHLANPHIRDRFMVGDSEIAEVEAPESFAGRSLGELELRRAHRVSVLALRRGERVIDNPAGDDRVESGDVLVVLGRPVDVRRLAALT